MGKSALAQVLSSLPPKSLLLKGQKDDVAGVFV